MDSCYQQVKKEENEETWKQLDNFENYEISSLGNVKNKKTNYLLKPTLKSGYLCLSLVNDQGKRKSLKVHRLVAMCFLPNEENKQTVNHKDHDKLNNKLENLEWATIVEQNNHKRKCKKEVQELISSRPVWRLDIKSNKKLQFFKTIKFASEWVFENKLTSVNNFNGGNNLKTKICAVARGKRRTAFGYKWEYDSVDEIRFLDEEWRDIPCELIHQVQGYKISNYGRVKNHKGRISEGHVHASGYKWIAIHPKQYLLHRLVAKVFIPNPENKEQVNHLDGNKQNAHVNNLEWCTNLENQMHKVKSGLSNTTRKVIQYDLKMNKIQEFESQTSASKELKISITSISKNCRGKQKSAGGFIFKFS
jgi:hypothetical protein